MTTQQAISNLAAFPARNVRNIAQEYTITEIDHDSILVTHAETIFDLGTPSSCAGTKVRILAAPTDELFRIYITRTHIKEAAVSAFTPRGRLVSSIPKNDTTYFFKNQWVYSGCNKDIMTTPCLSSSSDPMVIVLVLSTINSEM
jgi:hypothetical protein